MDLTPGGPSQNAGVANGGMVIASLANPTFTLKRFDTASRTRCTVAVHLASAITTAAGPSAVQLREQTAQGAPSTYFWSLDMYLPNWSKLVNRKSPKHRRWFSFLSRPVAAAPGMSIRRSHRPQLESLEDRCLLATHTVTLLTDTAAAGLAGELRSAIAAAAANDTINFAAGLSGTIRLSAALVSR